MLGFKRKYLANLAAGERGGVHAQAPGVATGLQTG
jgi:hypothetical protein